ncbi:DNA-binding protein [Brucella sp. 10RB9212]|uniref:single-stranded DNA-binding protein n=1 Tax=unclassified Brucella TaxID=2632610 RepID=UPI000972D3C5|nr:MULTISPECIES: single-stranded DNA-binding protein [unclassified Brucella]APY15762.1 hypothetical protein BKD02_15965 [Brucella sp. 09RB8910]MRN45394.1 DNA-binding protein [Brucella sp. 10RB9212]
MIKIEVPSNEINERSGTRADGSKWTMRSQEIYVDVGDKYPAKSSISLEDGQAAYAAGFYTLAPNSFRTGEYGRLELNRRIVLAPLPSTPANRAA